MQADKKIKIKISHLTHIYNEGLPFAKAALDDVNLEIADGAFVGLIGHTGSGKSTLIQHLNALLKPSSGHIYIDDQDILAEKKGLRALRKKVGLVFQYPEHQLFEETVFKDVSFGPNSMGLPQQEVEQRVTQALELTGVKEADYHKSPFELSGGQKRRVAIAGVLAMSPEVLILDEPTAGLDPRGRDELLGNLKDMHQKLSLTVLLVSHSMEDVASLCDSLIVMHKGKAALTGTPQQVFTQGEALRAMGLAVPQMSLLMEALREKGFDVPSDIYTTEGATQVLLNMLKGAGGER